MIVSIGTDICQKSRINAALGRLGDAFAKRILTQDEFSIFQQRGDKDDYLCRRFAAKEAVAKALGTGIGRGLSWQHINIANNEFGAPMVELKDFAKARFESLGANECHISISDEKEYAIAFVVFSRSS